MVELRMKTEMNKTWENPGFIYKYEVSARQDLNLRSRLPAWSIRRATRCHRHLRAPLRPEGLAENGRARHTVQTLIIRTFISFHIDYSIGYSYFKTKS